MAIKEEDIITDKKVREEMLNERNTEVLDKVKDIVWLGSDELVTINQVADYYEVPKPTIESVIEDHKDELKEDNLKVLRKEELKSFKANTLKECNLYERYKYSRQLTIFPRRAVLRVGMLLRDSEVAKTVRNYLLNVEEVADDTTKEWSIKREAGKLVRKQITSSISRSGENQRMYGHGYSNYTNLVYRIVFGKKASELYVERNAPEGKLREYFTEEELETVREVENTVAGLLNVGMEYQQVKDMLSKNLADYVLHK